MLTATAVPRLSPSFHIHSPVLILLSLVLAASPVRAQEKPTHGVSQDLLQLAEAAGKRQVSPSADVLPIRNGYVVVDFASQTPDLLLRDLEALGLLEGVVYGYMVSGLLPITSISALTTLPTLQLARPAYARAGTGAVDSEGDQSMRSDIARDIYGIDGTGITVGTLSDSYNCLGGAPGDVGSNDLPAGLVVLSDLAIATSPNCTDEGRAMMQIVHDVAPGVAQGFHTAFNGQADFALGIEELAGCPPGSAAGCTPSAGFAADVVNDDVFYFAEPFFQDGIIAQAVDRVVASGIAYFTLAGNHGLESYQAPFRNSGNTGGGGGTLHDFDPGGGTDTSQRITVPAGTVANPVNVTLSLQWVDPYFSVSGAPGAGSDLDIFIRDTNGNLVASSTNANAGADPIEVFTFSNNGSIDANGDGIADTQFDLQIELASGPAPALVKYIALVNGALGNFTQNEWDTQSSTIYGHMNTATGLTVGASRYQNTPAFGTDPPVINAFSSGGPTQIFFDINGNAIGPIIRNKPDVVGPDGANNTFFGGDSDGDGNPNFSGTSAATPHVAAVGALLLEAAGGTGSLPPAQIFNDLRSTAVDMDDPLTPGFDAGFDFRTGFGLVDALEAIHLYLNAPPVADAGADQTIECIGPSGATVSLDGSGSSDPEDDPLTYTWKIGDDVISGPTTDAIVQVVLPLGTHEVTLVVEDDGGESDSDTLTVIVEDTTPPTITVKSETAVLWPPNHAYRRISLSNLDVDVADVCDVDLSADDLVFSGASSDEEEDARGGGDGATLDDIVIAGSCSYVDLRSERLGASNGRVYTLDIKAADASGNVGEAVYAVHVPHDMNVSPVAIDDGPLYVVSEPACEPDAVGGAIAEKRREEPLGPQDDGAAEALPDHYALHANHPNPFNPSTALSFSLPEDAHVRLTVYDVTGRQIARVLDRVVEAGTHSVLFDGGQLPSGVYIYRIESSHFSSTRSMILLK